MALRGWWDDEVPRFESSFRPPVRLALSTISHQLSTIAVRPMAVREEPPDPKEGGLPLCRFYASLSYI
jgi:hypothetical protein